MKKVKNVLFLALLLFFGANSYGQQVVNTVEDYGNVIMIGDTILMQGVIYPKSDIQLRMRNGYDLTLYSLAGRNTIVRFTPANVTTFKPTLMEAFITLVQMLSWSKTNENTPY